MHCRRKNGVLIANLTLDSCGRLGYLARAAASRPPTRLHIYIFFMRLVDILLWLCVSMGNPLYVCMLSWGWVSWQVLL